MVSTVTRIRVERPKDRGSILGSCSMFISKSFKPAAGPTPASFQWIARICTWGLRGRPPPPASSYELKNECN